MNRSLYNILLGCCAGLVLFTLSATGRAQQAASGVAEHGVILLYHHVATDTPAITSISPDDFEQQLQFLEDYDFQVWPLPDLVAAVKERQTLPDRVVAITFDDNYQSVYTEAFPRLKKRNWPFTVFVSTDAVDKGINMQASWDQLREMARHGATIANHSASHNHLLLRLPGESDDAWEQRITGDIKKAQQRIRKETGQQQPLFAYPYGEFNQALARIVEQLGYVGIGQQSGPFSDHYPGPAIPRFPFAGNYTDIKDFGVKLLTLPLPIGYLSAEDNPLANSNQHPALLLELAEGDYATENLRCYGSGQGALQLQWLSDRRLQVTPDKPVPSGRSRYNCTMPTGKRYRDIQRFYWYSHPWIRYTDSGTLPD